MIERTGRRATISTDSNWAVPFDYKKTLTGVRRAPEFLIPLLIDEWSSNYRQAYPNAEIVHVELGDLGYLIDAASGRQIAAYKAIGDSQRATVRDQNRQRGFPPHADAAYQKGHMIARSLGGGLDVNLFHQLGHQNMGEFRALEASVTKAQQGVYFVHLRYYTEAIENELDEIKSYISTPDGQWASGGPHDEFIGSFNPQTPRGVFQFLDDGQSTKLKYFINERFDEALKKKRERCKSLDE